MRNVLICFYLMMKEIIIFAVLFFSEEKTDYAKNQASWTLLHKKKIDLKAVTETVLYDRLK